jgi:hypothetical protein
MLILSQRTEVGQGAKLTKLSINQQILKVGIWQQANLSEELPALSRDWEKQKG